jgi:HlyD family secretion protein
MVPALLRVLLPIVILALGVGGFAALVHTKPRTLASPDDEPVWVVDVEVVEPGVQAPTLTLYGRVESPRRAGLTAAVTGDVLEVAAREGRSVEAQELLVRLDDREVRAMLDQRRAELAEIEAQVASERQRHEADRIALGQELELLELARAGIERAQDLVRRNLGSQSQVDEARQAVLRQELAVTTRRLAIEDHPARLAQLEARAERARAQLALAELDLERTRVLAPFTGRVVRVTVAPGDRVRVGDRLVELYERDSLEVRAQVPGSALRRLGEASGDGGGLTALGQVEGGTVNLTLDRFAGEVAPGSGGVDAIFRVAEGADALALGRFVELKVRMPPVAQAVDLPSEALYGMDRIYRVEDGRMRAVRIERLGVVLRDGERRERVLVRSPTLQAGDQVVVTQLANAIDGLRVRSAEPPFPDTGVAASQPGASAGEQ